MLVAREAVDGLIRVGSPAVEPLANAMSVPAPVACGLAMEALTEINLDRAREVALDLLHRKIAYARTAAMRTIALVGNTKDIPVMIEALSSDSDSYGVVRDAVEALGCLRARDAVPALIGTLDHPEEWIALRAAHALAAIGDRSAIPALEAKLSPGTPQLVINAAKDALRRLDQPV
jgi:HEAT repeat protein